MSTENFGTHLSRISAALIGHGIGDSLTPAMHEAEAHAQGLSYRYDLIDVESAPFADRPLADIVRTAELDGYAGLNITHPFKKEVIAMLDELSDAVQAVGAANTVVFKDGRRVGHNTDYSGFKTALLQTLPDVAKETVLLLGAGGAGAAVCLALVDAGVKQAWIFDRDQKSAQHLAQRIGELRPNVVISALLETESLDYTALDGVVNATPMGMVSHPGMAIEVDAIPSRVWVGDIVYFPIETELVQRAAARGCRVMNGAAMAVHQAAAAFNIITDHAPDIARFTRNANALIAQKQAEQKELQYD